MYTRVNNALLLTVIFIRKHTLTKTLFFSPLQERFFLRENLHTYTYEYIFTSVSFRTISVTSE